MSNETALQTATLGGGCFWCLEAVFQRLPGVKSVVSGYAGGDVREPDYREVCTGNTGHAEVVQIEFDPHELSYAELLDVFFHTHDPTTLNRQGNDVGTQYRSVIFYRDDEQKRIAQQTKQRLEESGEFDAPIVTQIAPLPEFFSAEDYHQDYFRNNPRQSYCQFVIRPKLEKFRSWYEESSRGGETRG